MIDTNDSEFLSRVEGADLKAKICDAKTAAAMIQPGDILGIPDSPHAAIRRSPCMNSQNV